MAMAPTKPTDFNRALGDAKKQAGDVADAFTDAAQDVYGQARESAACREYRGEKDYEFN